ncbi:hypothetical protein ACFLQL_03670, partial [Verrucomicrobiota bacterium]
MKTTREIATIIRDRIGMLPIDEIRDLFERVVGDTIYYMGDSMWTTSAKDLIGLNIKFFSPKVNKTLIGKLTKVDIAKAEVEDEDGN